MCTRIEIGELTAIQMAEWRIGSMRVLGSWAVANQRTSIDGPSSFARLKTDVRRSEQLVQNSFKHWIVARQRAILASAAN